MKWQIIAPIIATTALALAGWSMTTTVEQGQRIARQEQVSVGHLERHRDLDARLIRIENKLDRILEKMVK